MSRISAQFARCREQGELALWVYLTCGDPDLATTEELVLAVAEAGADGIELGVPFSDPVADGPIIQRASERALRAGVTLEQILAMVGQVRPKAEIPLLLFSYFNPILQRGLERFAEEARGAGLDGVLAVDLAPEESDDYVKTLHAAGLDTVFLVAPTSTDKRLEQIAACSSGFIYVVSRTGVTGPREALPQGLREVVARVRHASTLPVAIGFGIARPEHVRALVGVADGFVVGSAVVELIEKEAGPMRVAAVRQFIKDLKGASRRG